MYTENQEMMSVADEFNFEITTKYKPEFKNQITYEKLYEVLSPGTHSK